MASTEAQGSWVRYVQGVTARLDAYASRDNAKYDTIYDVYSVTTSQQITPTKARLVVTCDQTHSGVVSYVEQDVFDMTFTLQGGKWILLDGTRRKTRPAAPGVSAWQENTRLTPEGLYGNANWREVYEDR